MKKFDGRRLDHKTPFIRKTPHWSVVCFRLTHSADHASASDRTTCFASYTLKSGSLMQYPG